MNIDSEIGVLRNLQVTSDGDFIIFSIKIISNDNNDFIIQPRLSRISSDFEIEWISSIGPIASLDLSILLWDIMPTSDGNFIAAGQNVNYDPPQRAGWFYKFTPQGDSIWSNRVNIPATPVSPNDWYGGVAELPGGHSYIAGGRATTSEAGYTWLTKVTKDGCLEDFCPDIYVSTSTPTPSTVVAPLVHPNPGSGYFRLLWQEGAIPQNVLSINIMTSSGCLVAQQHLNKDGSFDLTSFPSGLYFVEIISNTGERWIRKIVKE